jgi:hypothetical protein
LKLIESGAKLKKLKNLQNPWQEWHQHFSTLLEKLTTWRQYSGSWVGKQTIFRSVGGNERWLNDESMHWWQWCLKKANQQNKHSDHYWGTMLFKDSQWFSELQQQLMSNAALEGHFIIVNLGYPLEHGHDSWQMLSSECIWMNI